MNWFRVKVAIRERFGQGSRKVAARHEFFHSHHLRIMFPGHHRTMTRFISILLLLLSAAAYSQTPSPEPEPPMGMRGGFGKGKGKGKGRPMPPAPTPAPSPTPSPSPAGIPNAALFEQKILPVLQQKCFNCHQTGRKMKGGLAVDSHAALLAGGDSGPALVPGDAAKSLLYVSMTYADHDMQMPPREQLSPAVLADFKQWIDMGAPFSTTAAAAITPAASPEDGVMVTITGIRGNSVTFSKSEASSGMRGGMGMGKGGFSRGAGSESVTHALADKPLITSARLAQRTQDLLVGLELSGGLSNPAFDTVKAGGVKARIVIKDDKITQINVITAQDDSDAAIAVKPRRPPSKTVLVRP